jgi:hypothetical protein
LATDANIRLNEWEDSFTPETITDEEQVVHQFETGLYGIVLNEVPDRAFPITINDGSIDLDEVSPAVPPGPNEFRRPPTPKYKYFPRINMHESRNGETVYATYRGLGSAVNVNTIGNLIDELRQSFRGVNVYTSGSGNWTCPSNVRTALVIAIGGGGGGSQGGGGGGGIAIRLYTSLTPGDSYAYVVGAGGAGYIESSATESLDGGDSTFTDGTTLITASGGEGYTGGSDGNGGTGTNGHFNSSLGSGGRQTPQVSGSTTGGHGGGPGGQAGSGASGRDAPGIGGGGGGYGLSSGTDFDGGDGAAGAVIILY